MKPSLSIVPSIYDLMWVAELVTIRWGPKTSNPHLEATVILKYEVVNLGRDGCECAYRKACHGRCAS